MGRGLIRRGGAGLPALVLAKEAGSDEPFDLDRIPSEAGGIARLHEGRDTVGEKQDDEKQAQDDRKAHSRVRASGPSGRAVTHLTACPASHPTLRVFVSRRAREYQPR